MKISVLTPSFNSGKYIDRAIQSVLDQDYDNYEHIIADGGSKDETLEIIKKYDHLIYVSEPDKGQSDAMNKAFKMSSGEIIVYLNADDTFESNAFSSIVQAFKDSPAADMIIGNLIFTDLTTHILRIPSVKYLEILQYWRNLFPNNPVSYFYKRHVQEQIGGYEVTDHYTMDFDFLLKVYKRFKIVKIDVTLGTFYSDGLNKTAVVNTGLNSHRTLKKHLKTESPYLLPYFYFIFLKGMLLRPKDS